MSYTTGLMDEKSTTHQVPAIKIVVVGGAAGGISAALRIRRLDEKAAITFIETSEHACYASSGAPSMAGGVIETDTFLIHQSPSGLKSRFNLDVIINTELVRILKDQHSILVRQSDKDDGYYLTYDKLILAQGASPSLPHVPGINGPNVFPFQTMLDLHRIKRFIQKARCRSAAILGGGYFALKAVESLYHFGLGISIVHAEERICQDFDFDMANLIQSILTKNGIQLHQNACILKIGLSKIEDGCVVTLADESEIPADLILLAGDLTPHSKIAKDCGLNCKNGILVNEFMQTSDSDIYAVGEVAETANFISPWMKLLSLGGPASQQGRLAANHIMKIAAPYHGPIGTYSCRVPDLTVAIIGPSVGRLKKFGYHPQSITIHVPEHPGYYPASQQMTIRAAFQPASGRLLSAQIIGRSGVERRLDVFSTAVQAGMSVFDLEALELSYNPEYGSGKDPVNTIGMVGSNLLRGSLHLVTSYELSSHLLDWQIIDVRSPESFASGHVPAAMNVPIDSLRDSLAKLDKERPIVVYSRVGYHGYLAYRTLVQSGYQVANLDGGLKLLVEGGSGINLVHT